MKNKNNENVQELLAKFLDVANAAKAAEDIIAGERLFDLNPAPEPAPVLLAAIKQRMAAAAGHGKRHWRHHFIWQIAAMAAAFVVVGWAGIVLFQEHSKTVQFEQMQARQAFWHDTSDNAIDAQIAQLEQKEPDMPVITFEVNGSGEMPAINDVTNELTEIEDSLWEG